MPRKIMKKLGRPPKAKAGSTSSSVTAGRNLKKAPKIPEKKLTKRQAAKKRAEATVGKAATSNVKAWIEQIRKTPKFKGMVQVGLASELNVPYRLRRPSGILSLDIGLGGGFPAGGSSEISGAESVGKTALAYRVASQVQANYGDDANIMVVSTEIRLDKTFARKFGFRVPYTVEEVAHFNKLRKQRGLPTFTAEEVRDLTTSIGNVVTLTGATGEPALDAALEGLGAGLFQLLIIESLGALLTSDQDAGDVGDRTYGGSSVMLTSFMNKAYPLFMMDRESDGERSLLETTIIGINQARAEMDRAGPRAPKTHAAAGAYAWKHAQLIGLELRRGQAIRSNEDSEPIGREVKWVTSKGKVGTHDGKTGTYNFYHVSDEDPVLWRDVLEKGSTWGPDALTDLAETAKTMGVAELSGSWITWKGDDGSLIAKVQGAAEFANLLANDPELEQKLREQCLVKANLPVVYR